MGHPDAVFGERAGAGAATGATCPQAPGDFVWAPSWFFLAGESFFMSPFPLLIHSLL